MLSDQATVHVTLIMIYHVHETFLFLHLVCSGSEINVIGSSDHSSNDERSCALDTFASRGIRDQK